MKKTGFLSVTISVLLLISGSASQAGGDDSWSSTGSNNIVAACAYNHSCAPAPRMTAAQQDAELRNFEAKWNALVPMLRKMYPSKTITSAGRKISFTRDFEPFDSINSACLPGQIRSSHADSCVETYEKQAIWNSHIKIALPSPAGTTADQLNELSSQRSLY